jgi:WD40 repeat protein
MNKNKYIRIVLSVMIVIAIIKLSGQHTDTVFSQTQRLTLGNIIRSLDFVKEKRISIKKVITDVEKRKVDFPLTLESETLLRNEGANNELIETIRRNSPPVKVIPTPTPEFIIKEVLVTPTPKNDSNAISNINKTPLFSVIKTLEGHSNSVHSVSFSPDGKTLASGSWDSTIKLWNVETRTKIRTLSGSSFDYHSVSFSPDGKTLVSGTSDNTIKLWNIETGKEIKTLKGHSNSVNSVSFSPDGKTLASGSLDNTIKLWRIQ